MISILAFLSNCLPFLKRYWADILLFVAATAVIWGFVWMFNDWRATHTKLDNLEQHTTMVKTNDEISAAPVDAGTLNKRLFDGKF